MKPMRGVFASLVMGGVCLALWIGNITVQPTPAIAQNQLPPTFTKAPTLTPIPVPTLVPFTPIPESTRVPTITPRISIFEDIGLTSTVYFLSRRFSDVTFLARSAPRLGDFDKIVRFETENVVAFDVARDGKVAYGTNSGMIAAAGRVRPWKSNVKTDQPLQASSMVWSPDSTALYFSLRASEGDFQKFTRVIPTGIYVWREGGEPEQILVDRSPNTQPTPTTTKSPTPRRFTDTPAPPTRRPTNTPQGSFQGGPGIQPTVDLAIGNIGPVQQTVYNVASFSGDGKYLLIKISSDTEGKIVDGWGVYEVETKKYTELFRFDDNDLRRYQQATWNRDNKSFYVFQMIGTGSTGPSQAEVVTVTGARQRVTVRGTANLQAISAMRYLPDTRIVALGTITRDQPLQVFVGRANGAEWTMEGMGKAFRLKWPATMLTSQTGFPLYILDREFGVQVFNSGKTLAFLPNEMRLSAVNNTNAYSDELYPNWKVGPTDFILPSNTGAQTTPTFTPIP